MRPAPRACAGDDVAAAIAIDVAGGYKHSAGKSRAISVTAAQARAVDSAEYAHMRPAPRARRCNDVLRAIAIHIANGHAHTAAEPFRISQKTESLRAGRVQHGDPGRRPG